MAMGCVNEIIRPHRSLVRLGLHALPGARATEAAEGHSAYPRDSARKRPLHRNETKRQASYVAVGYCLDGFPLRLEDLRQG